MNAAKTRLLTTRGYWQREALRCLAFVSFDAFVLRFASPISSAANRPFLAHIYTAGIGRRC